MTKQPDLPKVNPKDAPRFLWNPGDVVIHKKGGGKKSVPPAPKDPQSDQAPKGGTK